MCRCPWLKIIFLSFAKTQKGKEGVRESERGRDENCVCNYETPLWLCWIHGIAKLIIVLGVNNAGGVRIFWVESSPNTSVRCRNLDQELKRTCKYAQNFYRICQKTFSDFFFLCDVLVIYIRCLYTSCSNQNSFNSPCQWFDVLSGSYYNYF